MLNGRKGNAVVKKMGWKKVKNQGEVGYARPQIVGATFAPAAPQARTAPALESGCSCRSSLNGAWLPRTYSNCPLSGWKH